MRPSLRPCVFLRAGESGAVNQMRIMPRTGTARSQAQAPGRLGVVCRGWEAKRQKARGRHATGLGEASKLESGSCLSWKCAAAPSGFMVLITLAFEEPSKEGPGLEGTSLRWVIENCETADRDARKTGGHELGREV